jgi:DNA-binding Lrp family transcriptional regulator
MDDMTRNILLSLQKESPLHVRELKRRTEINQTPLYRRLHELRELRLVKDDYLGSKRVFRLTAKGYKALMKNEKNRVEEADDFARSLLEDERFAEAIMKQLHLPDQEQQHKIDEEKQKKYDELSLKIEAIEKIIENLLGSARSVETAEEKPLM